MKSTLILAFIGATVAGRIHLQSQASDVDLQQQIPIITDTQRPCFIVGSEKLPEEVSFDVDSIVGNITCDDGRSTILDVPDVISGGISFSSINSADSDLTPLAFSLTQFSTTSPLAKNDVSRFQDMLNTYLATEAGIRSVGGRLDIMVPKYFLQFQIARIQRARGYVPDMPGLDVTHRLDKILGNSRGERKHLLDEVEKLANTYD